MTTASTDHRPDQQAEQALQRAGVTVRELDTPAACADGVRLLDLVWRGRQIAPGLLRTIQHTGGYVFGAYAGDALVGVTVGMLSRTGLHSHMTGVIPTGHRGGLGRALKLHQRAWAVEQGIRTISWTCDPLVRRNVGFNLHGLGATVEHYLVDHYGPMDDGVNRGDQTDRIEFAWDLLGDRASAGRTPLLTPDAGAVLVPLPEDIEALRTTDPASAHAWRHSVREALLGGLASGARVRGLTAQGELVLT